MAQRSLQLSLTQQQQNKRARYGASSVERGPLEGKPKSPSMRWLPGRVKDGDGEWVSYYEGKSVELFKKEGGQENKEYGKGTFYSSKISQQFSKKMEEKDSSQCFLPTELSTSGPPTLLALTVRLAPPWEGQDWVGTTSLRNLMNCFHTAFPQGKGGGSLVSNRNPKIPNHPPSAVHVSCCCLQLYEAHQHWPCLGTFT